MTTLIIFLLATLVVFLVMRSLWLWYFRINDIMQMLEWQRDIQEAQRKQNFRIIELLEKIVGMKPPLATDEKENS